MQAISELPSRAVAVARHLFYNRPAEIAKDVLLALALARVLRRCYVQMWQLGPAGVLRRANASIRHARRMPAVKNRINAELATSLAALERSVAPAVPTIPPIRKLPAQGLASSDVIKRLHALNDLGTHVDWQHGRVSGAIYHGGKELSELCDSAHSMFSLANPLHPDVFPGVRRMEAEVVRMVADMYRGGDGVVGCVTSGGTESILMATKAYRDYAKEVKGVTRPEMVVPVTAHVAFNKAAAYFGITLIPVAVDPTTKQVTPGAIWRAVNANTIMVVVSACQFPHGSIDPVAEVAELTHKMGVPLHVDCCLGGFLLPFAHESGFSDVPTIDFRLPGITSLSCDTHKYGFAPKGTSVVLYRSAELRKYQYTVTTEWPGGVYASPTVSGSRSGAAIAACWAALVHIGRAGYVQAAKEIISCARKIAAGIEEDIPGLCVVGRPQLSVVAFSAVEGEAAVNIYAVGDAMARRGWHLNALQYPSALHIACTKLTVGHHAAFLQHLKESVAEAESDASGTGAMAAMYGSMAKIPDRSLIKELATGFVNCLYAVN